MPVSQPLFPRHQRTESPDLAARARARAQGVAFGADHAVRGALQVEAGVEIERRAIVVELRAQAAAVGDDQVDVAVGRDRGAGEGRDGDALGRLVLVPDRRRRRGSARGERQARDADHDAFAEGELREFDAVAERIVGRAGRDRQRGRHDQRQRAVPTEKTHTHNHIL